MTIDPKKLSVSKLHSYLLGAVAPRPIAFASTIDKNGHVNLSPFSYFNVFSANPAIMIFSPARRGRDKTTKHTYDNVLEVDEVVINIVNFNIVEQMSLASTEYDRGIDEFVKSGLTAVPSERVSPPRVKESPASFECKVIEVKPLGKEGGAGNLVICEMILAHFDENILDDDGRIDPFKLDAVARMGGNYYCRAHGEAIFEIPKPIFNRGIGVDQIPEKIRLSPILTGNNLGRLGNIEKLPSQEEIKEFAQNPEVKKILAKKGHENPGLHRLAQQFLEKGDVGSAWKVLLQGS